MYKVIHQGNVIGSYPLFVDAWLHIVLELKSFGKIVGPDKETWIINPPLSN